MSVINDDLTECKHCGSELCYKNEYGDVTVWMCLTCGFTTSSNLIEGSEFYKAQYEKLPEIYKILAFTDDEEKVWIPNYVNEKGKGIIFLEGTDPENVKWVGVKDQIIKEEERKNHPIFGKIGEFHTHKPNMNTKREFGINAYIEAYYYIFGDE